MQKMIEVLSAEELEMLVSEASGESVKVSDMRIEICDYIYFDPEVCFIEIYLGEEETKNNFWMITDQESLYDLHKLKDGKWGVCKSDELPIDSMSLSCFTDLSYIFAFDICEFKSFSRHICYDD